MPLLGEPPLLLAPIQEVELSNDPRFSGWRFMSLGRGFARHCAENMSVLKACVVYLIGLSNSTSSWSLLNNYLFDKCNIIVLLVHFSFLHRTLLAFVASSYFRQASIPHPHAHTWHLGCYLLSREHKEDCAVFRE